MTQQPQGLLSELASTRVRAVADELNFNITVLDRAAAYRSQFARDGNRRRLFTAFDDLFGADLPPWQPPKTTDVGGVVRLRRLTLRNWKVFGSADLAFPEVEADRPVVLIGGKNGYGKTSLLEALQFGLFGTGAILDPLHREGATVSPSRQAAYRAFIESALHRPARERGERLANVRSEWVTPHGDLVVERRWFFDEQMAFVPDDETLTLWAGPELELVTVPPDIEPRIFCQQEIERRLLPASLAPFVFFDGEQVKRFAERQTADQVRLAAEAVLGLAAWRDAAADLKAYARDRARGATKTGAGLEGLASELLALETEDAGLAERLAAIEARRARPRARRDSLLSELAGVETGTYATLHEWLERQQALNQDLGRARHEFAAALSATAAILAPKALRSQLADRLREDVQHDQSWRSLFGEADARDTFLRALATETGADQDLVAIGRRAWDRVRETTPNESAERYGYLGGLRGRVLQALEQDVGLKRVQAASNRIAQLEAELSEVADGLSLHHARATESGRIRTELADLNTQVAQLDGEARGVNQRQSEVRQTLDLVRGKTLAEMRLSLGATINRPQRALHAAVSIERIVDFARPACFGALGAHVTQAYRALAHKGLVATIEVTPAGEVALFDHQGHDLQGFEASAGERQIFAMALLAAVGDLARNRLPLIIDTPLGRLDPDHRERILRYFSRRPYQTVLLSQPDEVNGRYLTMIESQVAARFRLDHVPGTSGGPGGSTPTPNAYPELAA